MSKPNTPSTSTTDRLTFHGKKALFAGWKDRVKAHLTALSDALVVTELQAGRQIPVARYEDVLVREPDLQEPGADASADEKTGHALQSAFIRQQSSYIKDLLNRTLPAGFADERLMKRPVHEIWCAIEKRYGLNTASGVVELVQRFDAIAASDFKTVGHLFQSLKAARDQVNRNSHEALKTGLISQQQMLIKVLAVLPGHLWGSAIVFTPEEFTLERVESKLLAIFGTKSRAEITALGKGMQVNHVDAASKPRGNSLGKRQAQSAPFKDQHYNTGARTCYYCAGEFNDMDNIGPHFKADCPKLKLDRNGPFKVFRRNIWEGKSKEERLAYEAALKVAPKGCGKKCSKGCNKGKGKAKDKPVTTKAAAPPRNVAADAVQAEAPASPAVSISPPSAMQSVMTPGSEAMEDIDALLAEDPLASIEVGANAGQAEPTQELVALKAIANEFNRMQMSLEDKDAGSD